MNAPASADIPLCVDLDGTLIESDLLVESCLALVAKHPIVAFQLPLWLLRGRAYLKEQIAARAEMNVSLLPYRADFLQFLKQEHERGRILVLATASHRLLADKVSAYLGIFSRVLATENGVNLSGDNKRRCLVEEFGEGGFDYAGNEQKDLHVWRDARQAILVAAPAHVEARVKKLIPVSARYGAYGHRWLQYLRAMRPYQWLKNLLVFLPLIVSHRISELQLLVHAATAFVAFGLCASSAYLLNDLLDLPSDRTHPRKRGRPFASGRASVSTGLALVPILLLTAIAISLSLPKLFLLILLGYYTATLLYSFWAKRRVIVDVMFLAGLYTTRILAGAAAVVIVPSFWLLAFSMFIFLSLALVKRYSELIAVKISGQEIVAGRGYQTSDLPMLPSLGAASGYMAVLVLALYVNSPDITKLYRIPQAIWLLCPMLLFWISRIWLKAQRGQVHDDPIIFALKDRVSRILGFCALVIIVAASYLGR